MSLLHVFFLLYCRTDDLKIGTLKGVDQFGNRYYENNRYFFGMYNYNACVHIVMYYVNYFKISSHHSLNSVKTNWSCSWLNTCM